MPKKKPPGLTALNLPQIVFSGAHLKGSTIYLSIDKKIYKLQYHSPSTLISFLKKYSKDNNKKILAIGISPETYWRKTYSKLWLGLDIVPVCVDAKGVSGEAISLMAEKQAKSMFGKDHSHKARVKHTGEVEIVPLCSLKNHEEVAPPEDFQFLLQQANSFKNKKVVFISATPQGGGVAILRHGMMRLLKLLGVDAKWFVLKEDQKAFDITKRKFHNVLQNVAGEEVYLTNEDKEYFDMWSERNIKYLKSALSGFDIYFIDDPQPSGLVPFIKQHNPKGKIIYRSHIELIGELADKKGSPQKTSWDFIWGNAKDSDVFISHPVRSFVPKSVPTQKVLFAPPFTDPLDGLNKELTDYQKDYYIRFFNKLLIESGQTPLDSDRPYIAQIARFDPSKGIPDLLSAYRKLIEKYKGNMPRPQLVIAGNGSIDDPDGIPIFSMIAQMLESNEYLHIKPDIKVIRLPQYDQVLNTLARMARVVVQLSYREGFEFKVAEAMMKGKPVIIYDSGGMPLQVKHGVDGFITKKGDIDKVAEYLFMLMSDDNLYAKMSRAATEVSPDIATVSASASYLWLFNKMLSEQFLPNGRYIKDLSGQSKFKIKRLRVIE